MAGIEQRLANHSLIGLDSSIFIYHLEAHPKFLPLTRLILKRVQSGQCRGLISTIAIMEITVHPWRLNRADVARQYEMLLVNFPHLRLIEVNRDVARRAAQLRAKYNLQPADALHVATAITQGATAWLSNDKRLKRVAPEIEVIILEDFV